MRGLMLIAAIGIVLSIMMHRCNAETTTENPEMSIQVIRYMSRRAAQGGGGGAGGGAGGGTGGGAGAGMGFGFGANMGGQAGGEGSGQGGR